MTDKNTQGKKIYRKKYKWKRCTDKNTNGKNSQIKRQIETILQIEIQMETNVQIKIQMGKIYR